MLLPADPKANYLAHANEIDDAIRRVLASGHYILGPEVTAFEKEFAAYLGAAHVITVANGTEALEVALRALGVRPGDLVATVANTVTATISAIEQIGARPVFVEIDPSTMVMDASALERLCGEKGSAIKAIVPVHLYGHPAPMKPILETANKRGIPVLEDCAQAHGAAIDGRKVGTWGAVSAFSFYPTKNLGALGDGGAVVTNDSSLAERVKLVRQYGWKTRYVADTTGRNSRLDEIQAAILRVKLKYLDAENQRRIELAAAYDRQLKNSALVLPKRAEGTTHVFHQYTVRTKKRDALKEYLQGKAIGTGVLYPVPVYQQAAYKDDSVSLPHTEAACSEVLCLPCHPGLNLTDIDTVSQAILGWRP
jgi:dTDP-4-amino-4,6-dideoxygalactose transaminase